jgi:cytochrome c oxidase cbb3-type subunit 4
MDVNDLRSAVTVISLLLFLCLVAWTWSRRRKADFDEAAQLPFVDEASATPTPPNDRRSS